MASTAGLPFSRSTTGTFRPSKPRGRQLALEVHHVVDEHHVVDQQVGELQIADRLVAAQADEEQRHAAAAGVLGGVGQRRAVGVDAVGQQHDAAGVVPRSSSSTARTPPPSRVLSPVGASRADLLDDARHVLLPAGPRRR